MRPDLAATREALQAGTALAAQEMEASIAIARSAACERAFLKTDFEQALRCAADPANAATPLAGLAVSVKDLFDVAGQTTAAGSRVLADAPAAARTARPWRA
jgi:Asp-tRNA(Asn)/Glu-tRNA(Gln) amidotransferase A subunit family amidase